MNGKPSLNHLLYSISVEKNKSAFAKFFRYYHPRLLRFAMMFVSSVPDAEDVVSEVMIKVLKQNDKWHEIDHFEGYLFRAIKNQAINHHQKSGKHKNDNIQDIPEDYLTSNYIRPFESILENELRDVITEIVEKLPPQRRLVYKMIKDDNLKIKEVAELLNLADKTVKKHLELAIKNLKTGIEAYYAERKQPTPIYKISKNTGLLILLFHLQSLFNL